MSKISSIFAAEIERNTDMKKSLEEIIADHKKGIETEDRFGQFINHVEAKAS